MEVKCMATKSEGYLSNIVKFGFSSEGKSPRDCQNFVTWSIIENYKISQLNIQVKSESFMAIIFLCLFQEQVRISFLQTKSIWVLYVQAKTKLIVCFSRRH